MKAERESLLTHSLLNRPPLYPGNCRRRVFQECARGKNAVKCCLENFTDTSLGIPHITGWAPEDSEGLTRGLQVEGCGRLSKLSANNCPSPPHPSSGKSKDGDHVHSCPARFHFQDICTIRCGRVTKIPPREHEKKGCVPLPRHRGSLRPCLSLPVAVTPWWPCRQW